MAPPPSMKPELILATEPCVACGEQSDREGGSALNLCNSKRIRVWREECERLGY
jgi:hypothetical protein